MVFRGGNILRNRVFLIESQVACHGSHKPAVEDAPWQLIPMFILDGLQESRSDARGSGDFIKSYTTHFSFAL
jgi:hypothetical protein